MWNNQRNICSVALTLVVPIKQVLLIRAKLVVMRQLSQPMLVTDLLMFLKHYLTGFFVKPMNA